MGRMELEEGRGQKVRMLRKMGVVQGEKRSGRDKRNGGCGERVWCRARLRLQELIGCEIMKEIIAADCIRRQAAMKDKGMWRHRAKQDGQALRLWMAGEEA